MVIIKALNLISIVLVCTYLGIIKSRSYENRVRELNRFQSALVMFKSKLEFTYEPIKHIFTDISTVIYENNDNIFFRTIQKDKEIYLAWSESVEEYGNSFEKEDKEIIRMFGKLLGKTDIKGQVNEIVLTENLIQKQIEKAEFEKSKNSKLYKAMGVILGVGICIILI